MSVTPWPTALAEQNPDLPFLITPEGEFSYGRIEQEVLQTAGGLAARIRPGELVGVRALSTVEAVVTMLAVPRAGGILVPIDSRLASDGIVELAERLGIDHIVDRPSAGSGPVPDTAEDAPWAVVPTSGTTGHPKGVVLTAANLEAAATASAAFLGHQPGDRWLCVLPLHHVGGLMILLRSAHIGGTVVLEPRFDARRAAELLHTVRFASFVPTMLSRVLEYAEGPYQDLSTVLVGGGPLPPGLLDAARSVGIPAVPTYGATETAAQIATGRVGEATVRALPGVSLQIFDTSGIPIDAGSVGEIVVDGPMVSPGYWGVPARTGPHHTGDLGLLDMEGNLTVLGRVDDMVITGGENVYPVEIERALMAHPSVSDAAVWGVPHDQWGSVLHAAVVAQDVDLDELRRWVRQHLAGYKVPKVWHLVETIPRSRMGKLDRKGLEGR